MTSKCLGVLKTPATNFRSSMVKDLLVAKLNSRKSFPRGPGGRYMHPIMRFSLRMSALDHKVSGTQFNWVLGIMGLVLNFGHTQGSGPHAEMGKFF